MCIHFFGGPCIYLYRLSVRFSIRFAYVWLPSACNWHLNSTFIPAVSGSDLYLKTGRYYIHYWFQIDFPLMCIRKKQAWGSAVYKLLYILYNYGGSEGWIAWKEVKDLQETHPVWISVDPERVGPSLFVSAVEWWNDRAIFDCERSSYVQSCAA